MRTRSLSLPVLITLVACAEGGLRIEDADFVDDPAADDTDQAGLDSAPGGGDTDTGTDTGGGGTDTGGGGTGSGGTDTGGGGTDTGGGGTDTGSGGTDTGNGGGGPPTPGNCGPVPSAPSPSANGVAILTGDVTTTAISGGIGGFTWTGCEAERRYRPNGTFECEVVRTGPASYRPFSFYDFEVTLNVDPARTSCPNAEDLGVRYFSLSTGFGGQDVRVERGTRQDNKFEVGRFPDQDGNGQPGAYKVAYQSDPLPR